ncbi:MAG: hypothetical protein ABI876_14095 [Bacteroidota bacterium]
MRYISGLTSPAAIIALAFTIGATSAESRTPAISRIALTGRDGHPVSTAPITLLQELNGGGLALATADGVMIVRDGRLMATAAGLPEVLALAEVGGKLYAGTAAGLYQITIADGVSRRVEMPALKTFPRITSLVADNAGALWIGTGGYGLFSMKKGSIDPIPGAPFISSLAATPDGSVWIGTNIGLHRVRDGVYHAYSEEIHHEGLAIPDNIVERLQTDRSGRLWVFMSNAVSVIDPEEVVAKKDHIDPATYAFIGAEENGIYALADGPRGSRWIASEKGLFMLSGIEIGEGAGEHGHGLSDVLTPPKGTLINVADALKGSADGFGGMTPRGIAFNGRGDLIVAGSDGLWRIDRDLVRKMIGG